MKLQGSYTQAEVATTRCPVPPALCYEPFNRGNPGGSWVLSYSPWGSLGKQQTLLPEFGLLLSTGGHGPQAVDEADLLKTLRIPQGAH